ncbi:putative U6 snRNA-associated Sm-like protein LSm7 [Apostichopus japonicus]|uniref:Putative U6 snRNA-associated Sm-like protein LSm7 n=1 Tax=Stichopus japonicus TaxID=307972 RepID=A0A2G8LPK7_STIJA|nr:putative U6 snRNA-associated Sm-like protein LSm7 [Apostichopus japonicus]
MLFLLFLSVSGVLKGYDPLLNLVLDGATEYLRVSGVLKGYDPLLNLVLDGATEYLRDPDDPFKITDDTRELGLTVCRGTSVVLICPSDNMEPIANPFLQQDG